MQYSKILPIITGVIFVIALFLCVLRSDCIDSSVYVSVVSVTGGVFGAAIIWYMKKAQAENIYKLKKDLYRTVNKEQIHYMERVMDLKKKYSADDMEINDIQNGSRLDEMTSDALSDIENTIRNSMSDAEENVEIRNY